MNLDAVKHIHFLGIGGIGMSALARYFKFLGKEVSGYDKTSTELTTKLLEEGIEVYFEESLDAMPNELRENPTDESLLVIYTPAIPEEHIEFQFFKKASKEMYKRAEILGLISRMYPSVGIAGTHGKTTTSSILSFILLKSQLEFITFVGGINENFDSNLLIKGEPSLMVTEADEYDRSFLKLNPKYAIITSIDPDHLDIYETADQMRESFKQFSELVPDNGRLLIQQKLASKIPNANAQTYGLEITADYHAANVDFDGNAFSFDVKGLCNIQQLKLYLPGYHNLENALAAIAMAHSLGVSDEDIKTALKEYKGVKRRFEYQINTEDFIYIDDYAHHPKEIDAVLQSVRKMYPGKKITTVFQPHLYSRTKDFAEDFALSLSNTDTLILLDIYPAREEPMPGITSEWLLGKVNHPKKFLVEKDNLPSFIESDKPEILLTLGAGDIDQCVKPLKERFS